MMGPSPQCYIPSQVIGPLVLEKKISEGFLPYMGVAANLVIWPGPSKQTFVPPTHWGSIWNLALIGQVLLEKKTFENGGQQTDVDDGPWLFYQLNNKPKGSGELKKYHRIKQAQDFNLPSLYVAKYWATKLHPNESVSFCENLQRFCNVRTLLSWRQAVNIKVWSNATF